MDELERAVRARLKLAKQEASNGAHSDATRVELAHLLHITTLISEWCQVYEGPDELGMTAEGYAVDIQRMLHPEA